MGSKHDEKKLALVASMLGNVIHDMAHGEVHRQVSELRESVVFNAQRLKEMDEDMTSAEGNLKHMMDMVDVAIGKVNARIDEVIKMQHLQNAALSREIHEAVANLHTPDDQRIAKHERRTHRLEEQMTEIIRLLGACRPTGLNPTRSSPVPPLRGVQRSLPLQGEGGEPFPCAVLTAKN